MNLSHTLFTIISNKLRLKTSLLNEEKFCIKTLKAQIKFLKKIKENNCTEEKINKPGQSRVENNQNLVIMYIINVSFLKANTTIHVSDIKGNMKLFYSAGSVGLVGKQKRRRPIAASKLISLLVQKAGFLDKKPVALHLNNVNSHKSFLVNKLKKIFYIRLIKSFNQTPYNGCRKKKLRRKKYKKKFK